MANTLNIAVWNKGGHWASRLKSKLNELTLLLVNNKIDILVVGEANLQGIASPTIPGYEIIKENTNNNRVIIIHRNYIQVKTIESSPHLPTLKILAKIGCEEITIIGAYREFKPIGAPYRTITEETNIFKEWWKDLKIRKDQKLVLGGDLNLDWNKRGKQNFERKEMLQFLETKSQEKGMIQQTPENTRCVKKSSTMIDPIFTKNLKVNST